MSGEFMLMLMYDDSWCWCMYVCLYEYVFKGWLDFLFV